MTSPSQLRLILAEFFLTRMQLASVDGQLESASTPGPDLKRP
jgi:hypothetical protein